MLSPSRSIPAWNDHAYLLTYFSHMQHIIFHYFYFVSVKAELGDTKYDIADRLQVFLKRMTKDAR